MDADISKLLEDIPEKPPRSKLEPHADVINALRRKRRTYREIAQFFREHLAITVAPSTIHDIVRVRRRREKRSLVSSADRPVALPRTAAEDDAQQKIAALKRRIPAEGPQPLFTYQEEEPLKLRRKPVANNVD